MENCVITPNDLETLANALMQAFTVPLIITFIIGYVIADPFVIYRIIRRIRKLRLIFAKPVKS